MKKTLTIVIGIMLMTFLNGIVRAESSLEVATPAAEVRDQEQSSDQTYTNVNIQYLSGHVSISRRNKAKIDLEQQKKLRQEQIDKEKAAEAAPQ